jgi:hypothetical protein
VTKDIHTGGASGGHPEGDVDVQITKIASEKLMTFSGPDAVKTVPRESTDGADQMGEIVV